MPKGSVSRSCAVLVFSIAAIALLGWATNQRTLVALAPNWITMKIWTAIGLMLASVHLFCKSKGGLEWNGRAFGAAFMLSVMQCGMIIAATLDYILNGENVFIVPGYELFTSWKHSMPSLISVLVLALYGFISIHEHNETNAAVLSWVLAIVSMSVILGYVLGIPALYFSFGGFITPVAINTGFCLAMLWIGLENIDSEIRVDGAK